MPGYSARPPAIPTVLIDDQMVRVTRWDFEPGAATGHHVHGMGYVVVTMTECEFLVEDATGEHRLKRPVGDVYRRDAGVEHNVINGGKKPMTFIEIEYK